MKILPPQPKAAEGRAMLHLPLDERRARLAAQAESMVEHYSAPAEQSDRMIWQGGEIVECE